MNEKTIVALAKLNHINNAIWPKLKEETIKDFTTDWEDLTDYQRELYIAGVEFVISQYRLNLSPLRLFWRLFARFWFN